MRSLEGFLFFAGMMLWGVAFLLGPESGAWSLGKAGVFVLSLSVLLRLTEFLIPNRKPMPKRPKGPARKCPICGKPAVAGSAYCSYHARYGAEDERR